MANAGEPDAPVPGKVTLVYFWANWCGPCRVVTPALEKMAAADADIALRKIDLTRGSREEGEAEAVKYNIMALPHVKVYNRSGSLVGTDVNERSRVTSRRLREVSRHARARASVHED